MPERIVRLEKRKRIHSALMEQLQSSVISKPSVSPCKASCYAQYAKHQNEVQLNECLDDCRADEAVIAVAERLHTELCDTFIDVVWKGGDIDPLPFERMVRERFSHPRGKK